MIPPKRLLFVDREGGGNLPPVLALAHRLVERGHSVRFMSEPCNEEEIQTAGCHWQSKHWRNLQHRNAALGFF